MWSCIPQTPRAARTCTAHKAPLPSPGFATLTLCCLPTGAPGAGSQHMQVASCHRNWLEFCRLGFNPQLQHRITAFLCWFLHLRLVSSSLPLSAFYDFGNWSGIVFSSSFTLHLSKGGECIPPQTWCVGSAGSLWTTAPSQDACVLLHWTDMGMGGVFFPLEVGFYPSWIQHSLRPDHDWQFIFSWAALLIRQSHLGAALGAATGVPSTHRLLLTRLMGIKSQREEQMEWVTTCLGLDTCEPPHRGFTTEFSWVQDCWAPCEHPGFWVGADSPSPELLLCTAVWTTTHMAAPWSHPCLVLVLNPFLTTLPSS